MIGTGVRWYLRSLRTTTPTAGRYGTGVTALSDGADQLFVRAILDQGGQIEVIVPAARYREGLPATSHPRI